MTICDRIAVMDQGVVQQIGTPVELFDRPVNRFVAQFVGSVNLFEGTVRHVAGRPVFASALGDCALPDGLAAAEGQRIEIAFRPHAVNLAPRAGAAPPAPARDRLALGGVIEGGEFLGEFMRYEVRVERTVVVADQPHLRGMERLAIGTPVDLSVQPGEIRVIAQ